MEKRFKYNQKDLSGARITFWVYAVCIPIIVLLYFLPIIQTKQFVLSPFTLIYPALVLFLLYQGYRSLRVLLSVKKSFCSIEGETVFGVSIPNPFKKESAFRIEKQDILSVAKSSVSVGTMRPYDVLVINTQNTKYTLFAIERLEELKKELEP